MRLFLIYILFSACSFLSGQVITGTVVGDSDQGLVSASTVLLSKADSTFVNFGLTNDQGQFLLENKNKKKELILQVTYLGYKQYSKEISLDSDEDLDLGKITLESESQKIDEVTVEGERIPIKVNKDTVIYDANAFKVQPNDVVEDLLRKMPGIEVESDGTIIAQGEEVQSILVDGKEFFGNDPKVATKNLPAEAVDKVEVYDKMSDKAEFTGIDDGEREKTMNLELKESHKNGMFGNARVGYGTENRYDGGLSLNRYSTNTQLSLLANLNNINQQGFSVNDYVSFMGASGGGMRRISRNSELPISQGLSNGFVRTSSGGVNLNHDFSDKIELRSSYLITDVNNDIASNSTVENFGGRVDNFISRDTSFQNNQNQNHRINVILDIEPDSSQEIRLNTTLRFSDSELLSRNEAGIFSGDVLRTFSDVDYNSFGKSNSLGGQMSYRKKFGRVAKRIISLEAGYNNSTDDLRKLPSSITRYFQSGLPDLEILQLQLEDNDENDYNIDAAYIEPLGNKQFLELSFSRENYDAGLVQDVYDQLVTGAPLIDSLSTAYTRDYRYDQYALAYYRAWESTDLTIEGGLQRSIFGGYDQVDSIQRNNLNFLPRISLMQNWSNGSRSRFNYNTRVREPGLTQLQPILDNSDPQNVYIGNQDLVNEYNHTLRINFIDFDQFSFSSWFVFLTATYTRNKIVNQTIFDDQFRQITKPVNVRDEWTLLSNVSYSRPIRKLGIKMRLNTRFNYRNSIAFINAQQNDVDIISPNINLTLENRDKDKYDLIVGTTYGYSITNYSEDGDRNRSFLNRNYFVDMTWTPHNSWEFGSRIDIDYFDQEGVAESQVVPIWRAHVKRFFGDDRRVGLELSIFDILDRNNGIEQSADINNFSYSEINSLGRYAMCKLIYSLRSSGAQGRRIIRM